MSLDLYVDGARWRAHLRGLVEREPSLVPVAKGNGYGFGLASLARRAAWLGADTIAVGNYREVAEVEQRFAGSILVMEPWRPFTAEAGYGPRVIHTLGRPSDVTALVESATVADPRHRPRAVLEARTSMSRHGFDEAELAALASGPGIPGLRVEGHTIHLPLPKPGGGNAAEAERLLSGAPARTWFASHLTPTEMAGLRAAHPGVTVRPRVGTDLWLGDRGALEVRSTVLDARPVTKGERVGYRGRRVPSSGTLLVVSGGTNHGIGLEAPPGLDSAADRARVAARHTLELAGRVRSPFFVGERQLWFAEPPHMQVSLVLVPSGLQAPAPGETLRVRVRYTITRPDAVHID